MHRTPNTEKAIAELVRVIRPGREIELMLYNRHSLVTYKCWVKQALPKGRPWKSLRWVLWNHIESIGTKGYTRTEFSQMLEPFGLTDIRFETFLTSADRIAGKSLPLRACDALLGLAVRLAGNKLGWFICVSARKR